MNIGIALIKGTMQNIVMADAIIIWAVTFFLLHEKGVHTVFSILIGLLAGGCFIALTKIPYFGKPFVVVCGLIWTFGLYQLIDGFGIFHKMSGDSEYIEIDHALTMLFNEDPIWW